MKYILGLILSFFMVACSETNDGPEAPLKPYEIGEKIVLKGVNGGQKTLVRVKDGFVVEGEEHKVLMIDLFGTFCVPCRDEAPHLTDLQRRRNGEFIILGLTHLEDVTDEYVKDNFSAKHNAYYFISNGKENARIAQSVTDDIAYKQALQVPFKVVLKEGVYQNITDVWEGKVVNKYYIGKIDTKVIESDLDQILSKN